MSIQNLVPDWVILVTLKTTGILVATLWSLHASPMKWVSSEDVDSSQRLRTRDTRAKLVVRVMEVLGSSVLSITIKFSVYAAGIWLLNVSSQRLQENLQ